MSELTFQRSLPKKRMSAGALFMNRDGGLLIVEPVDKSVWEIPGGVVKQNESPRQACQREVEEELGLKCSRERLLVLDYLGQSDAKIEALASVFWGGTLTSSQSAAIRLAPEELRRFAFLPQQDAVSYLNDRLGRRVKNCLLAFRSRRTMYLEDQRQVFC